MRILDKLVMCTAVAALASVAPLTAYAKPSCPGHPSCKEDPGDGGGEPTDPTLPPTYTWMHPDVGGAFASGFTGAGSHLVILDNFGGSILRGKLTGGRPENRYHGSWVSYQAQLTAPGASFVDVQNSNGDLLQRTNGLTFAADPIANIEQAFAATTGVDVVNLSFGLLDPYGTDVHATSYTLNPGGPGLWDTVVDSARAGNAVFVKAAGNASVAVDDGFTYAFQNVQDSLNLLLVNAPGALFVGALEGNGSVSSPASLASYSSFAGDNPDIQNMFLVVGVDSSETRLSGTSFGAPIVSGYAAMLGKKYAAQPDAVVDRLLDTARTDTIAGYHVTIHGQGEACLSCALAPDFTPQ